MVVDAAGVGDEDVRRWAAGLEEIRARLGPHCARRDAHQRATPYLRALLSPVERKNGWHLAEIAGDHTPYGMRTCWGAPCGMSTWCATNCEGTSWPIWAMPRGMLILDETSVPKKGTKSAGVGRQYCGSLGKRETCQVSVLLAYAGSGGCAFIDRELSLPKDWTGDPVRLRAAGVPTEVSFLTKPEIGRRMLERALDSGTLATWALADEGDGGDYRLRSCLESRRCRSVLAVAAYQDVWVGWEQRRVDEVIRGLEASAWSRLSCGNGTTGPRISDWARISLPCPVAGWERWALCRRSVAEPEDLAYDLVVVPSETPLAEIVRAAGSRWRIAEAIADATGEVGLDHYEVRSWRGWYQPFTLALLAQAYLVVTRSIAAPDAGKGGMTYPNGVSSLAATRQRRGLAC